MDDYDGYGWGWLRMATYIVQMATDVVRMAMYV